MAPALARVPLPEPDLPLGFWELCLAAGLSLALVAAFAVLRSALLHSVPARVLEEAKSDARRRRLQPLLLRAESLATSARTYGIAFHIVFVVFVLALVGGDTLSPAGMGLGLLVAVPLLVVAEEVVPAVLRGERSDALLRRFLPAFELLQKPLAALVFLLEALKRGAFKLLRIPERPRGARKIVEDLRSVVEDSERVADLHTFEREIIENVVAFNDVDVAEVMTPRTELAALDVSSPLSAAAQLIAESGHTRIPIYEGNLDTIIGTLFARDFVRVVSEGAFDSTPLSALVRPVPFVPETKLAVELLGEFRRDGADLAIVLDEYGGTAGLVTVGDIVAELFGEMPDGQGEPTLEDIRAVGEDTWIIHGGTHVSDVNESLELELPEEEDFETLAGFVLAELGRMPKPGEGFEWEGKHFEVLEASDRRVLSVRVSGVPSRSTVTA